MSHERTKSTIQQNFQQLTLQLDTTSQTFLRKVEDQHRLVLSQSHSTQLQLATQSGVHHRILSKLDAIHDHMFTNGRTKRSALSHIQDSKRQIIRGQSIGAQTTSRTRKSNAQAWCPLTHTKANVTGVRVHDGQHAQNLPGDFSNDTQQSQRVIYFFGEDSDQIVQCLLPITKDAIWAIDHILANKSDPFSKSLTQWLRGEFNNLRDSAIRELAAQHSDGSITSLDPWIYLNDSISFNDNAGSTSISRHRLGDDQREVSPQIAAQQALVGGRRRTQTISVSTPSRAMLISIPRARKSRNGTSDADEASFTSVTTQDGKTHVVQVRFLRKLAFAAKPRLCTQLNIFVQVEYGDVFKIYTVLFKRGALADIDHALRTGTISPYHIDQYGDHLCFYVSWSYISYAYKTSADEKVCVSVQET